MKILITTESYYPDVCGVSHVVTKLAEGLASKEHEVIIFTEKRKRDFPEHKGVKVVEFDVKGNIITGYKGEIKKYQDALIKSDCDVMINECAQIWSSDLAFEVIDKIKAKKVFHSHGYSVLTFPPRNPINKYKFYRYFKKMPSILKKYDHIFYLSSLNEDKLFGDKHNIKNFSILNNGVEEDFLHEPSKNDIEQTLAKYNISIDKPLSINVSNYSSVKNQEESLKAIYKTKTIFQMVYIGSKETEYLERLYKIKAEYDKKYGFKEVKFLYGVSREDIKNLLYGSTLFIHSSKREAFPLVIVEGIASLTPFISSNVGNLLDYDDKYGIVYHSYSVIPNKIDDLFSNKNMLDRYISNCQSIKNTLGWNSKVNLLETKLLEIAGKNDNN